MISTVLSILVLKELFFSGDQVNANQVVFLLLFVVFGVGIFVFAFNQFFLEFEREMRYAIFASTVLNGLGLYELYSKAKGRNMKGGIKSVVIVLLFVAMIIGLFNTFNSPILRAPNGQVTATDMSGMSWFFARQDGTILIDDIMITNYRFANAILGVEGSPANIRQQGWTAGLPPNHFGYTKNETLGQSYADDRYLIENKLSRIFYAQTAPDYEPLWRFNQSDFERLQYDASVNMVYSNGDLRVYRYMAAQKGDNVSESNLVFII